MFAVFRTAALLVAGWLFFSPAGAGEMPAHTDLAPSRWKLTSGLDYSRGDYGFATPTETLAVPLALAHVSGNWTWRGEVAWLSVDGPADVALEGDASALAARPATSRVSGLGDVLLSASRELDAPIAGWQVEFHGKLKLPTANEAKGLGTGRTDFTGLVELYRQTGRVVLFGSLGYRWRGRSTALPLRNGVVLSAGGSYQVATATWLGASYDWRQRSLNSDYSELTAFVTHRIRPRLTLELYASRGFSEATADFGGGAALIRKF